MRWMTRAEGVGQARLDWQDRIRLLDGNGASLLFVFLSAFDYLRYLK
jgi:hypothetical protein